MSRNWSEAIPCRSSVDGAICRRRPAAPASNGIAPSGPVSGIAAGIDDDGALRVRVGGQIHRIISGEVRWQ